MNRLRPDNWKLPPQARYGGRVIPPPPVGSNTTDRNQGLLVDGVEGLGFEPRTLYLSAQFPDFDWERDREINATQLDSGIIPGILTMEFMGLHPGGRYYRRFDVPTYRQVRIPVETFTDFSVRVVAQVGRGFAASALASEIGMHTNTPDPLFLSTSDVAGDFIVPPGADRILTLQADGGFAWLELQQGKASVSAFPFPLAANTEFSVFGSAYRVTVANLDLIWRVFL